MERANTLKIRRNGREVGRERIGIDRACSASSLAFRFNLFLIEELQWAVGWAPVLFSFAILVNSDQPTTRENENLSEAIRTLNWITFFELKLKIDRFWKTRKENRELSSLISQKSQIGNSENLDARGIRCDNRKKEGE